jgi:hypothetical protein
MSVDTDLVDVAAHELSRPVLAVGNLIVANDGDVVAKCNGNAAYLLTDNDMAQLFALAMNNMLETVKPINGS